MEKQIQEEVQAEAQEQDQEPTNDQAVQQDQTIDDKLEAMEKRFKSELQGLNKAVSEKTKEVDQLKAQLKEKEMETLSASEKAKVLEADIEAARKEREKILNETQTLKRQRIIDESLSAVNLPLDVFGPRIVGETQEEIEADVKALNEYITEAIKKGTEAEINKKLSGPVPASGKSSPRGVDAIVNENIKKGGRDAMDNIVKAAMNGG